MTNNILDPSAILSLLPSLLPTESKLLASPQDAIAALLHASLSALTFRLTAVGDTSPQPSLSNNTLPVNWNNNGPGHYTFRYRHEQSSLEFLVNIAKLGKRTVINAIALEVSIILCLLSDLISL
jgi:proteasome inhibitor subunit 1 (PI31)